MNFECEVLTVTLQRLPIVFIYTMHDQTLNRVKDTNIEMLNYLNTLAFLCHYILLFSMG